MRRLIVIFVLVAVPALAVVPVSAGSPHGPAAKSTPIRERASQPCKQAKGQKKATCKKAARKKPKPARKKKRTARPTATRAAKPTAAVAARSATPTPTFSPTPTVTSTPTATDTPGPSSATINVLSTVPARYQAAFFVCGLPGQVTASFAPNPVMSVNDSNPPTYGAAHSALTVWAPRGTPPGTYPLALRAYYEDRFGNRLDIPPPNTALQPPSAVLTVDGSGSASVQPSNDIPAVGNQSCSPVPAGFAPVPTSTPAVGPRLTASVSDSHPSPGERVTVTGTLELNGAGVRDAQMIAKWYMPYAVAQCASATDAHGSASCSVVNDERLPGFVVQIQVVFTYQGAQYVTYTSYIM